MQYMLMIYSNEVRWSRTGSPKSDEAPSRGDYECFVYRLDRADHYTCNIQPRCGR